MRDRAMKGGSYYEHLQTLGKGDLIRLLYRTKKPGRPFPYQSHRTIALRLSYDGAGYSGVQHHDFIRSIEDELSTSIAIAGIGGGLVFCGRTDAGVSAVNMVASLRAKSRLLDPNRGYTLAESDRQEYPYDKIINERLPGDIRVTGWAPVPDDFHARHSCIERTYRYYFVLGDMDLGRICEAAERIGGMTNFYHLSTHSNDRAVYGRRIDELAIEKVEDGEPRSRPGGKQMAGGSTSGAGSDDLYCLTIRARSFLHNMVRKIVWVIKNCGRGNEFSLKDVKIAEAYPLVFAGARFGQDLSFIGNRFTQPHFRNEEVRARILHRIARLRFSHYAS